MAGCRGDGVPYIKDYWLAKGLVMPVTQATPFFCPTCGVEYKLVRVETKELVPDQQISCRKCGSPLPGAEGRLVLKYFSLAHRARRQARGGDANKRLSPP
jgi:predicted RNA-binding Zn-ribbon protein involved in translation (DUF1610 family)